MKRKAANDLVYNDQLLYELAKVNEVLERAIGRVPSGPFRNQLTSANIMVAGCREAAHRVRGGADPEHVFKELVG